MKPLMPDEALSALEDNGFNVSVREESLLVGLRNRRVTRNEVAEIIGVEPQTISRTHSGIRIDFPVG